MLVLTFAHCKKNDVATLGGETTGEKNAFGNGNIQTYAFTDNTGSLTEAGIIVDDAALQNLPVVLMTVPFLMAFTTNSLDFPATVADQTGITHLCFDYYPRGHDPVFAYGVPQINFYYHYQTEADRLMVGLLPADSTKFQKVLLAGEVPPTFIDPKGYVPKVGAHLVDVAAPEFNGVAFDKGWIYGKYDGKLTFMEELVSMAFLQSVTTIQSFDVKQPTIFPRSGKLFPTKYNVAHNATTNQYKIFLSGFVKH